MTTHHPNQTILKLHILAQWANQKARTFASSNRKKRQRSGNTQHINHLTERSSLHSKVVTAVREPYRGRAAGAEWKLTSREVEVPYKFFSRSVINFSDTSKSYCLDLNSLNVIHFIIITLQKFYDDDQENAMHRYLDFRNSEASVCEPFKNWTCVHTKWRSSQIFAMLMNFLF